MKSDYPKYRFPGLNSFSKKDAEIFKGRDDESANLFAKISLYKTIVLHADSGTGKSSLIQAGLLPLLEKSEENYFPVILRINEIVHDNPVNPLIEFTLKKIKFNIEDRDIKTPSIALLDEQPESFWKYSKILEKAGYKLLLIFDQFENLQTFKPEQINHFIVELYNLINPKIPANVFASIEIQFSRLVDEKSEEFNQVNQSYLFLGKPSVANLLFSIREDKLGVMSLLSEFFPDILKNDFVIRHLLIDDAYEALTIPAKAKGDFESSIFEFQKKDVAHSIINKIADEGTGRVDPILLQIVASSIEINEVILKGKLVITNEDIPEVSNIVVKYYNDCLDKIRKDLNLTELQISEYKKTTLTKFVINERRTLVNSGSIEPVASDFIDELVKIGLIRKIPAEKETIYYQLIHDRMIEPIIIDPKIIESNYFEKYLKSIKFANKVAIISVVPLLLSWVYIESNYFNYSRYEENLNKKVSSYQDKFNELSNSNSKYYKLYDSILLVENKLKTEMSKLSSDSFSKNNNQPDSILVDSLYEMNKKLKKEFSRVSLVEEQVKYSYIITSKEKRNLTDEAPLAKGLKIVITVLNILLWGLLIFFQFARRISLKYLFKEVEIYKKKKINKYDNFKLFFPFWLAPVSKTNYILLGPVKPVSTLNNTFKPNFLNFIWVLCLLIIVVIQFRLTYISYAHRDKNLDLIFYFNVLFSLFSIVTAAICFTPLNNKKYNNEKENSKILHRKDFITISLYSILAIALFKLKPILSGNKKTRFTGIKKPRYKVKNRKPEFNLSDYKSQIVINKNSKIIHYIDDKGFSLTSKSIQNSKDFIVFKHNIEILNQLESLAIKGKPRISIKDLSWNAEHIALNFLKSGSIEMAVKILLYGIKQNYKSSLRLTDLLALICIRHNTTVSKDALDQLINYYAISKDKMLIKRVEKWQNQNWRNKILKRPKIVFNQTKI